jgi:peptide/nickel transport system permease protein
VIRRALARIGWSLVVVWAVTTLAFFVNVVLPSDPARMVAGPQARPKDVERIRMQLGLDRPIAVQYGSFLRRLVHVGPAHPEPKDAAHGTCAALGPLHLDLGRSYQQRRPVTTILAERLPRTLFLAACALFVQVLLGTALGTLAASRKGRWVDRLAVGTSLLGISAPTFVIGLLLQYVLAHRLRLLPLDGYGRTAGEHAIGVILPALTLGLYGAASYVRFVRDELIGIMKQDFVRTARAKGVGPWGVLIRHGLRNALVPLSTLMGLDLGMLLGGAIVTETLFRWPGLGALSVSAMLDRDGPVILGTVLVTSSAIVLSNLLVDASYAVLDPRVRRR